MEELVQLLVKSGVLKARNIIAAFRAVDRKDFVLPEWKDEAYEDYPLPIGAGQTISQPYTVAFMFELLGPKRGEHILDVGSGSGWTTALLAHIVGERGNVWGIEVIPELVSFGSTNLAKYAYPQARIIKAARGKLGYSQKAPFERILVSAATEKVPDELVGQLKEEGVMVVPVQDAICKIVKKKSGEVTVEKHEGFAFVPLV